MYTCVYICIYIDIYIYIYKGRIWNRQDCCVGRTGICFTVMTRPLHRSCGISVWPSVLKTFLVNCPNRLLAGCIRSQFLQTQSKPLFSRMGRNNNSNITNSHCFKHFTYSISLQSFTLDHTVGKWWSVAVSKAYTLSTGSRGLPQIIWPLSTVPLCMNLLHILCLASLSFLKARGFSS